MFGTYLPPTSLSATISIPAANRSTRVPEEVLTDAVIEEIKTRCCFVSDTLDFSSDMRASSPSADDYMEMDAPPSDSATSESEFSRSSVDPESTTSSQPVSSEFSVVSHPRISDAEQPRRENHLQALASMYTRHSTATELRMRVVPPASQQTGTGRGTLVIPGWVRERAAEVLFEGGDVDESSVAEVILDALLKVINKKSSVHCVCQSSNYTSRSRWTSEKRWHRPFWSSAAPRCCRVSFPVYMMSFYGQSLLYRRLRDS